MRGKGQPKRAQQSYRHCWPEPEGVEPGATPPQTPPHLSFLLQHQERGGCAGSDLHSWLLHELWNATDQTGSRGWQWDSEGCAGTDGERSLPPSLLYLHRAALSLSRTSRPFLEARSAMQSKPSADCVGKHPPTEQNGRESLGMCQGQQEYLLCWPVLL